MSDAFNPVDGTRIRYTVVDPTDAAGDAPDLVLVHGSVLSSAIWRGFGYVKALRPRFRLIVPDLRGHGRSGKPHDPAAYSMKLMAGDLLAVLDAAEAGRPHYLGYSLGARAGLALAISAPERLRTLIPGGGSARPHAGEFDRLFFPGCTEVLEASGMEGFIKEWEARMGRPVDPATKTAFLANDGAAMAAYFRGAQDEPGIDEAVLAGIQVPTLVFVGSNDGARLADAHFLARTIPGAEVAVIPGPNHATTPAATRQVLEVVVPFLDRH